MKLRLHTRHLNSAGQRVRIVLNLKGVPYEYAAIQSPSSKEYRSINPQGLMPALEIDGRFVAQSMAIIELLEELFPEPSIFPEDNLLRAEVRAFAHSICSDLHPINNLRIRRYLTNTLGETDDDVGQWYHHWVGVTFQGLETTLSRQPSGLRYCFGSEPTLAEACLVPQIYNARRFECDLAPYPRLVAVDAACRELAAFKKATPKAQPDFAGNDH